MSGAHAVEGRLHQPEHRSTERSTTRPQRRSATPIGPNGLYVSDDPETGEVPQPAAWLDFSRLPVHREPSELLQAKLTVNAPGDAFEQEADQVADRVLGVTDQLSPVQQSFDRPSAVARATHSTAESHTVPADVDGIVRSPGNPLDPATRAYMEPRFGRDFSEVRVHADAEATRSANGVQARAYTVGNHIVFGAGTFAPATHEGRRLLAHELTHVVQQTGARATAAGQSLQGHHAAGSVEAPTERGFVIEGSRGGYGAEAEASHHSVIDDVGGHGLVGPRGLVGNQATARLAGAPRLMVQRSPVNESPLAEIQGLPMFKLLPTLEALPVGIRSDEQAGRVVGGPRLVTAVRVVAAKGSAWEGFKASHEGELAALPPDQVNDISAYLRAHDVGALRSTIPAIAASDIRANWGSRKQDFLAAANDPSNSLNAAQLYQIWLHYWLDEQAAALAEFQPLENAAKADMVAYTEKLPKFHAGRRGIFPPDYEAAADRLAAANYYGSYLVGIRDWLETYVDAMHNHVTLGQVNLKAVELIKNRGLHLAVLGFVLLLASLPIPRRIAPKSTEGRLPGEGAPPAENMGVNKVWGGGGPGEDVMPLYRYSKNPGDVTAGGWWTTRPAATQAEAARLTGVPENETLYCQKILVNASPSKYGPHFKLGPPRSIGDSLVEEFRNTTTIPKENIEVTPVKAK